MLGPGTGWPVTAGVLAATISANIVADRNVWGATGYAFCSAGAALLVAWKIDRHFGPDFSLGRLRNVWGHAGGCGRGKRCLGGWRTVTYKLFENPTAPVWTTWYHWLAADVLGIAAVARP